MGPDLDPRRLFALLLSALILLSAGCTKRREEQSTPAATRAPDVLSYDEAVVGHGDTQVNAMATTLKPWAVLWRHAYGGFTPDSLIRLGTQPAFRNGHVQPLREVYPPAKESVAAFRILSARSPDRRYELIFDGYQCVLEKDGRIEIGGDADSAPLLLDRQRNLSNRFDFCGPGTCVFHWGAWLSPSRFVIAGTENDEKHMGIRGRVQLYSLEDSTVTTYVTRPVHSSRAATYQSAWESWVVSRYREPTASRPMAARSASVTGRPSAR